LAAVLNVLDPKRLTMQRFTLDTERPGPALLAKPSTDARLVRFACRVMLVANLLPGGFFCYFVVSWRGSMKDLFAGMGARLPPMTIVVLSVPASAYWANADGIAAILILLEAFCFNRKITLIANSIAIVLFALAIVIVEVSLRMPLVSLIEQVQRQ
jgi:hypothetical protein